MQACDDELVQVWPTLEHIQDWTDYLAQPLSEAEHEHLRQHTQTGRPLGDDRFIDPLERLLQRPLRPQKWGPKPRRGEN